MKKITRITFVAMSFLFFACGGKKGANTAPESNESGTIEPNAEESDDYTGDAENKSYKLGKITFISEGKTFSVNDFGIDPYTVMIWFTPESGVSPMAGVVFKSSDFKISSMVNFKDFDAMQENFQGKKTLENGQPIVSFVSDDATYMFSNGNITIEAFSRKTGKVKLRVEGKVNKSVWGKPAEMKTDLTATLEIDAFMPFSNVDGTTFKTEAAQKFKVQKP